MSDLRYPYGFIYETICIPKQMKYRGSHKREQNPEDPDDSWYLGSPTNPQFWEDLEEYGRNAFKRVILEEVYEEDKKFLKQRESYYLKEVDAMHNPDYYNKSNSAEYGGGSNEGMRLMHKGDIEKFFYTEQISLALSQGWEIGVSDSHRRINSEAQKGKTTPPEVRRKISEILSTDVNPMSSLENRKKVAESKLGKIWINNGIEMTYVNPDELDYYISLGYSKGMIRTKNQVSKDYDCCCKVCGKEYKGGKYSSMCKKCYSEQKGAQLRSLRGGNKNGK